MNSVVIEMEQTLRDQYCVFQIDDDWFAVLAASVREIGMKPEITPVPRSSPHLVGLCHLQNQFLPIVELTQVHRHESRRQMAIVTSPGGTWAILVDRVLALTSIDFSTSSGGDSNPLIAAAVMGTATFEGRIVRVFDVHAVYRKLEKTLSAQWSPLSLASLEASS